MQPEVSIVIGTIARSGLVRAVDSVFRQRGVASIQILIGLDVDMYGHWSAIQEELESRKPPHVSMVWLNPGYSTSQIHGGVHKCRFGGSLRATLSSLAASRHVMYLDDDDWLHEDHCAQVLAAIRGRTWAFSLCMYSDGDTGEAICPDHLESVGINRGVYKTRFGGFVRPSGMVLDKMKVLHLLHLWCEAIGDTTIGEDRLMFEKLRELPHVCTGNPTVYYALDPRDGMHPVRMRFIRSRGKDYRAASKNESVIAAPRGVP